jgi:subtilisin family serine protease
MKSVKVFILLILFSAINSYVHADELSYYYAFDKKIEMIPVKNKILVKKKTSVTKLVYENSMFNRFSGIKADWQGNDICKLELKDDNDKNSVIQNSFLDDNILSVSNIFKTSDGLEFGFTNEIVVKFKENVKDSEKISILKSFGLKKSKTTKIYEVYAISKERNIVEIANKLYESGLFEFAYPNIICKAELFHIPNDPYFQYQITLRNTGQTFNDGHSGTNGADISAPEAWDITTGNSNIVIAVFDEGVTSNHPDLPNTRQVRLNGSNFGSGNPNDPSPVGNDNHGNSCAGVIAATMDNNEGIAGIAPNCKIMPLRWDPATTSDQMADGIRFAADNGANIISNSWGYGTSNNNYVPAIVAAIQYAVNKGVVVVFAAGNTAEHTRGNIGYVTFPANVNVNSVITVGASDRYDSQSNYSPSNSLVDIVAPSHRAYPSSISTETFEMWSLDIPGNTGYNPWPSTGTHPPATGEMLPNSGTNHLAYTGRFGGTSHSCPVVAGVCALILSLNPNLSPQQVYNILINTTDKVGGYLYSNGKSSEMGYGRVNAYAALQSIACPTVNFTDRTVSSSQTVTGCDIYVRNVTVTGSNVKLTLDAANQTTIDRDFEVRLGSELEIK